MVPPVHGTPREAESFGRVSYDRAVPRSPGDDEITVPEATRPLGIEPHTVYALIERGELHADVTYPNARPRQRRSFSE